MTFNELLHFCNGHQRPSANCYIFTKEKNLSYTTPFSPVSCYTYKHVSEPTHERTRLEHHQTAVAQASPDNLRLRKNAGLTLGGKEMPATNSCGTNSSDRKPVRKMNNAWRLSRPKNAGAKWKTV